MIDGSLIGGFLGFLGSISWISSFVYVCTGRSLTALGLGS